MIRIKIPQKQRQRRFSGMLLLQDQQFLQRSVPFAPGDHPRRNGEERRRRFQPGPVAQNGKNTVFQRRSDPAVKQQSSGDHHRQHRDPHPENHGIATDAQCDHPDAQCRKSCRQQSPEDLCGPIPHGHTNSCSLLFTVKYPFAEQYQAEDERS